MADLAEARILALDIGQRRVGVAVSDPMRNFAVGLETVVIPVKGDWLEILKGRLQGYTIERVVIGLPKTLRGEEGAQAERVREIARRVEDSLGLPVVFLDERLTSVLAHQTLRAQGIQPSRNKGLVDEAAAKRILQDYLDGAAPVRPLDCPPDLPVDEP